MGFLCRITKNDQTTLRKTEGFFRVERSGSCNGLVFATGLCSIYLEGANFEGIGFFFSSEHRIDFDEVL